MDWMKPFLDYGVISGKIICPNKKCNAKLGNYDWAGVCCSCKEWVTPVRDFVCECLNLLLTDGMQGFCIHRSKVDEIV